MYHLTHSIKPKPQDISPVKGTSGFVGNASGTVGGAGGGGAAADQVSTGTGREGALGYVPYIAIEHMDKVRAGTAREGALGYVGRDCVSLAQRLKKSPRDTPPTGQSSLGSVQIAHRFC
jgi:hypothetical protein